jgi:hypothetical protein
LEPGAKRRFEDITVSLKRLGARTGIGGHKLVTQILVQLLEDPEFRYGDAALGALIQFISYQRLKQDPDCREVIVRAASRLQQGDTANHDKAASILKVLE